jgi:ADP-L-glycero-D-manno-heptose 6-epimerase
MVQGFRYHNIFGKYQHLRGKRANVIHKWRQQARKEGKISVWEGAENIKRDFTYAVDICQLHLDFMTTVKGSGIWNVGTGMAQSFEEVAKEIAEAYGARIEYIPMPADVKQHYQTYTCADMTKMMDLIHEEDIC